ncbi:single-strand selective monofunctional uracil DNA glycosylase [Nylanderia fulva]|uniref:single-strand selective monofunctional uracil DNA glycosylase n=1 Tax=Nylanderia fulva TaxID=613905 RepID=UPI0010FB49E5|nr:single-strand selective monofunctional uracil DNA glycosylase [Nylanderia fulva]
MSHSKRTRVENDDLPNTKKLKQSDQNSLFDFLHKTFGWEEPEKNVDVIEHSSTVSSSNTEKDIIEHVPTTLGSISNKLLSIEQKLCTKLQDVTFPSTVQYIYNPLEYASETHAMYVHKYCTGKKKILFLGMNPGPWGMSQTGVPFGEISMVRNWLKIVGPVGKPSKEHPDRKVTGFECTRSEISGLRLWGLFRDLCESPENFFRYAYMHNCCPFAFMDTKARNITPAELKGEGQRILHEACDKSLIDIIKLLKVEIVVGIGNYAEKRAQIAVQTGGLSGIQVMVLRHPSPRAVGNQNWNEIAMKRLDELGLLKFFEKASTSA